MGWVNLFSDFLRVNKLSLSMHILVIKSKTAKAYTLCLIFNVFELLFLCTFILTLYLSLQNKLLFKSQFVCALPFFLNGAEWRLLVDDHDVDNNGQ